MFTLKRLGRLGVVTAVLTAASLGASAVPTFEAPPQWQARPAQPPPQGTSNCTGQTAADDQHTAPPGWNGSDEAALSEQAQRALHGADKADLNSHTGRCRLVDATHDSQEPLNDGVDPKDLLKLLDELGVLNRTFTAEEEQTLLDRLGSKIHIQFDSNDQQLHAYIGDGANRQDLGALSRLDPQYLAEDDELLLRETELFAQAEQRLQNALGGANPMGVTAAIPEPGTYAMLLAGLLMVALVRRRKRGGARLKV